MSARYLFYCLLAVVVVVVLMITNNSLADGANSDKSLVGGENKFALDLYGKLKSRDGNLFFSPYSISTCLGMTYVGARGETAKQMAKVFHFSASPSELPTEMAALEKQLKIARDESGVELNTANGLWAQTGHPFIPAYMHICREQFGAQIKQADFHTAADATAKEINGWVSDQTRGKITDLIQPGVLNGMTRLVLVNTIYFKGRWKSQFEKSATASEPFNVTAERQVQTPMMRQEGMFRYADAGNFQLLELPYGGEGKNEVLAMDVLLPKALDGLKNLENGFDMSQLINSLAKARLQEIQVFLPRFKVTAEFGLAETLAGMGMPDAFNLSKADFSGMDGRMNLYISAVVHKAYVDVNEEGTEAAAATGVAMAARAVVRKTIFRADRPFIFLIRDTRSGEILFLGRLNDPTH